MPVSLSGQHPPPPPAWAPALRDISWIPQCLGRPLRIAEPCCGVGNATDALHCLNVATRAGPAWDIQGFLAQPLQELFGTLNGVHLGPRNGDVLKLDCAEIDEVDGLVAGPPCPPWSSTGKLGGHDDKRAAVFWKVIEMVATLSKRSAFKFAILENVPGLLRKQDGGKPAIDDFEEALRTAVGCGWVVGHWVLQATDFLLASQRRRVFIFAVKGGCPSEPLPISSSPPHLKDFLIRDLPSTPVADLTETMACNLAHYKGLLRDKIKDPACRGTIASIRLDRKVNGVFGAWVRTDNTVETLATTNAYIFLLGLGECTDLPELHRWLDPAERTPLMGIHYGRLRTLTKAQVLTATGNAYPVPMIGAVLHAVLTAVYAPSPDPPMPLTEPEAEEKNQETKLIGPPRTSTGCVHVRLGTACHARASKRRRSMA